MPDYMNDLAPPVGMSAPQNSSPGAPAGGAPIAAPPGNIPGGGQPGGAPATGIPEADAPPEIQEKVITLGAKAKSKIYEDPENFQNMMAMLEGAGAKGFPEAASTIVNTVLDQVEKEEGPQSEDILAAAGAIVLGSISEDLTVGGAMEVTPEMFNKAAAKAMQDWMTNHPERVDQQAVMGRLAQGGQQAASPAGMGAPAPAGMEAPAPGQGMPSGPAPQQPTTTVPEPGGYLGGG